MKKEWGKEVDQLKTDAIPVIGHETSHLVRRTLNVVDPISAVHNAQFVGRTMGKPFAGVSGKQFFCAFQSEKS
jgi:hypothetical protein